MKILSLSEDETRTPLFKLVRLFPSKVQLLLVSIPVVLSFDKPLIVLLYNEEPLEDKPIPTLSALAGTLIVLFRRVLLPPGFPVTDIALLKPEMKQSRIVTLFRPAEEIPVAGV